MIVALLEVAPGYMDSEYYFSGGLQLVNGEGFSEPFLWNYLDNPEGIPHPSHTYWMPLPSILAAAGMWLTGVKNFLSARIFFILLSGLVPVITAHLAYLLTQKNNYAIIAGFLSIFGGFFTAYLSNTESFSLYMVFGGLFVIVAGNNEIGGWKYLLLGLIAGVMHMSRADGILWLGAAFILLFIEAIRTSSKQRIWKELVISLAITASAYLLVSGPWYLRNLQISGTIFSPASGRALWLTQYNDLYIYPADQLNMFRWLEAGWKDLFLSRLGALWMNLKTIFAVQGEIFLFPLILMGLWGLRKKLQVQMGTGIWVVTLLIMTFIFPFAGARGGMLHSGAGLQPLFWAVVPTGIERFTQWAGRKRNWNVPQAVSVFNIGAVLLSAGLSLFLIQNRIIGSDFHKPIWSQGYRTYLEVGEALDENGIEDNTIIMVNNPPGFFLATRYPSIVIPSGPIETVLSAAKRYGVKYLVVEKNTTPQMALFYKEIVEYPGIDNLYNGEGFRIYHFE